MLSTTLRVSRSTVSRCLASQRPAFTRSFIVPSAVRQADLVQDLYLRELKNYKPAAIKENDHEGQVKKWSVPAAPKTPDLGTSSVDADLKAYESQAVEVEGTVDASSGGAAVKVDDWFEEDLVFEEEKDAH